MTPQELEEHLLTLPRKIWLANKEAIDLWEELEKKKAELESEYAKQFLLSKAKGVSVAESEEYAVQNTYKLKLEAIIAESKYKAKLNEARSSELAFSGYQSAVKLITSEIRSGIHGS
jgi:hypothetical protein